MKGGAGQYFTPRPLIQAIVDVMRAAGTGNPAFSAGRIASNSFSWHARMLRIVKKLHYLKVTIRATLAPHRDGASKRQVDSGGNKSKQVAALAGAKYTGYIDGSKTISRAK